LYSIIIDAVFFITWIISGMLFLAYAYIFRIKNLFKDTQEKDDQRDDPWMHKKTECFFYHISTDYYEVNAITTMLFVSLYLLLRDDKNDTLLETPGMVKYFWPHTIMLIVIIIPRAAMFACSIYISAIGKVYGDPGTGIFLPVIFLVILTSLGIMLVIYFTNEKDLRSHPLIYCWCLN
jgi:hypothetical protein